jgi:hypothetical protein
MRRPEELQWLTEVRVVPPATIEQGNGTPNRCRINRSFDQNVPEEPCTALTSLSSQGRRRPVNTEHLWCLRLLRHHLGDQSSNRHSMDSRLQARGDRTAVLLPGRRRVGRAWPSAPSQPKPSRAARHVHRTALLPRSAYTGNGSSLAHQHAPDGPASPGGKPAGEPSALPGGVGSSFCWEQQWYPLVSCCPSLPPVVVGGR